MLSSLKSTANASLAGQDHSQTLNSLDNMISRMQGLKRKMEVLHEEEQVLHQHSRRRIQHLQDLYEIPSLADVKYDEWSRIRLNRLLVDYLLRSGYGESARALAREKDIEELVDLDVFVQCHKISESLRKRSTQECLAWCAEHKPLMRKTSVSLFGGSSSYFRGADTCSYRITSSSSSDCSNILNSAEMATFLRLDNMRKSTSHHTRTPTLQTYIEQQVYLLTRQTRKLNRIRYVNPRVSY